MTVQNENKFAFLAPQMIPVLLFIGYFTEQPYLFIFLSLGYLALLAILDFVYKRDTAYPLETIAAMPENDGFLAIDWYWLLNITYLFMYVIVLGIGIYYAQYKEPTLGWILYSIPVAITGVSALCFWSIQEYHHLFIHHNANFICTESDTSAAKLNQSIILMFL